MGGDIDKRACQSYLNGKEIRYLKCEFEIR